MKRSMAALVFWAALSAGQTGPMIANLADAKWVHETSDPPGAESLTLREGDAGTELLARYPAGHVFAPHWHSVNERILLIEGKLSLGEGRSLDPGGYAFLQAREVQHMSCVSKTRCTFYVAWDGKLDFHRATAGGAAPAPPARK
jgi:anti-sigma factor ChrR (cupin superfamily)